MIWTFTISLDSSQCPLSSHVVCAYIITNYKLLDGLEGNNKELFLKEELPPRECTREMRKIGSGYQLLMKFKRYLPKHRKMCICTWHDVIVFHLSHVYVFSCINFQEKSSNENFETRGIHGYLGGNKIYLHDTR